MLCCKKFACTFPFLLPSLTSEPDQNQPVGGGLEFILFKDDDHDDDVDADVDGDDDADDNDVNDDDDHR